MKQWLTIYIFSCLCITLLHAGSLEGSDGPSAPTGYFLISETPPAPPPQTKSIAQINKQFQPDILSISVGHKVAFPNTDQFVHNVYSNNGIEGFFDLGTAPTTLSDSSNLLSKQFNKEGVVHVSCAIHPVMQAIIFVLPAAYHTSSRDGHYQFTDVPSGTYSLMTMDRKGQIKPFKTVKIE